MKIEGDKEKSVMILSIEKVLGIERPKGWKIWIFGSN